MHKSSKNSKRTIRKSSKIVYSTCSVLKDENEKVVQTILNKSNFEIVPIDMDLTGIPVIPTTIEGTLCVCPTELYEGFYVAKLKRIK